MTSLYGLQNNGLSIQTMASIQRLGDFLKPPTRSNSALVTPLGCWIRGNAAVSQKPYGSRCEDSRSWEKLASLLQIFMPCICGRSPEDSLRKGEWVKLICGASFEDTAEVRNLSLVYTLGGVDCIDCAADPAIVAAVVEGIGAAKHVAGQLGVLRYFKKPWVMVSINDDEDPHFRKAEFDARFCPPDCLRPCERVCPAAAINLKVNENNPARPFQGQIYGAAKAHVNTLVGGVVAERCYGCGRCITVCPVKNIGVKSYVRSFESIVQLLCGGDVQAIEIHTGAGHLDAFSGLWKRLGAAPQSLKLIAVSVPDLGKGMISSLSSMFSVMKPSLSCLNLWQLDGRPMSGDIGKGATAAAVSLAASVASSSNRPPGYLQLAGGTNFYTLASLKKAGLFKIFYFQDGCHSSEAIIAGIAFGGYARKVVRNLFASMEQNIQPSRKIETYPPLLLEAVKLAILLVGPVKDFHAD